MDEQILNWLLEGDVSIRYQARRDLMGQDVPNLRDAISEEGWGARFLACRNQDGHWGRGFYQPKWTSTHYTLLDLRLLEVRPDHALIRESVHLVADGHKGRDGGVNPAKTIGASDVCVNGMFLNYASYFGASQSRLESVIDFIIDHQLADGGFNCRSNFEGARHSSVHTTLSILEGILEYQRNGYPYRVQELSGIAAESREFLLRHRLFRSDRTGEIIRPEFLRLSFPPRWKFNILRALDYFRAADFPWDERMGDALEVLIQKRRADGRWPLQAAHPGQVHFTMEDVGAPSRWNTLIALRVLQAYSPA